MKRLTQRFCGGLGVVKGCELDTLAGAKAVVNRLAAYEDTGLEPEEIKRLKGAIREWKDGVCILQKHSEIIQKLQAELELLTDNY